SDVGWGRVCGIRLRHFERGLWWLVASVLRLAADAFQLASHRLRNDEVDEAQRSGTKECVEKKGSRAAYRPDQRKKCERDNKVGSAGTDGGGGNTAGAQPQRKDLRNQNPCDGAHTEREADDVDDEAAQGCGSACRAQVRLD